MKKKLKMKIDEVTICNSSSKKEEAKYKQQAVSESKGPTISFAAAKSDKFVGEF